MLLEVDREIAAGTPMRDFEETFVIARVLHGRQNWMQSIFPSYDKE